jgi:hypothetical protein
MASECRTSKIHKIGYESKESVVLIELNSITPPEIERTLNP